MWPCKGQDILCEKGTEYLYIIERIGGGDNGVDWSGIPHAHELLDRGTKFAVYRSQYGDETTGYGVPVPAGATVFFSSSSKPALGLI